jgi:putative acyl-CoA dehydrogenase
MPLKPRSELDTHEVLNQPSPREALALWEDDAPLRATVERWAPAHRPAVDAFAAEIGSAEAVEDGRLANRYPPELVTFDRSGRRLDEVRFHPAYHATMRRGFAAGYSAIP